MTLIAIHSSIPARLTLISNVFIDHYMPVANGEFVKIYLYLVRTLADGQPSFSLDAAADIFSCTEADILRALRYWEKCGLLTLTCNADNQITDLSFAAQESIRLPQATAQKGTVLSQTAASDPSVLPIQKEPDPSARSEISTSRMRQLKSENEEISQLLFLAEQYMGKPLTPTEINRILYFYDTLHFPLDLLEYLIEYCVSKGHTSIHYIEKVGTEWHKAGIRSVDMAKSETNTWNKNYFLILKAFGIRNRNPVEREVKFMNRWLKEYDFTIDIICEACSRTVSKTGHTSFEYAEKILESWKASGVHHIDDISHLDHQHKKKTATAAPAAKTPKVSSQNKFNNFQQRDYDYDELEKQLLFHSR